MRARGLCRPQTAAISVAAVAFSVFSLLSVPAEVQDPKQPVVNTRSTPIPSIRINPPAAAPVPAGKVVHIANSTGSGVDNDLFPSFGFNKSVTEIVQDDVARDGVFYDVPTSMDSAPEAGQDPETYKLPFQGGRFISTNVWRAKCFYETHNFCVLNGTLTFFHDPLNPEVSAPRLRMCTEFSQHSTRVSLKHVSLPMPAVLPAPLYTKTPAWILQYWCQDLFHMTLTGLPAYHTRKAFADILEIDPLQDEAGEEEDPIHPDVFIRIARGRRHAGGYCNIKFGDPRSFEDVRNSKWSGRQFPIAGNPYWPFYKILTPRPDRIFPLESGRTAKNSCYTNGIIDKLYIKDSTGKMAREYSTALLRAVNVSAPRVSSRRCGNYRMTLIDRRGRTRRLLNIPEIAVVAAEMGFTVTPVALETLPFRKQLELVTSTDVLMGVHGNGLSWLQFLPPGSAVVELVGVFYTPYSLLWGHTHFHSSIKNNLAYKKSGEFSPFSHNITEIRHLLVSVREHLDSTSCGLVPFVPPSERLGDLYQSCRPHC